MALLGSRPLRTLLASGHAVTSPLSLTRTDVHTAGRVLAWHRSWRPHLPSGPGSPGPHATAAAPREGSSRRSLAGWPWLSRAWGQACLGREDAVRFLLQHFLCEERHTFRGVPGAEKPHEATSGPPAGGTPQTRPRRPDTAHSQQCDSPSLIPSAPIHLQPGPLTP